MKRTKNLNKLKDFWRKAWLPPPRLNAWQWCEQNVYLPAEASPRPGRYSTDLVPYVRTPMECWTDKTTEMIVLMWSAQSTKTTCEFMCMAYDMANYQGNIIFNMPSEDMAKSKSLTTLQPIIEASPVLRDLKPNNRNKYKILEMHMKNGVINLIGGNSATNLSSRSAGRIYTDEIDKLKQALQREADPLSLLFERAEWFQDSKFFLTSTPTVEDGHVNQWFLKGTQEYLYYPCPFCDVYFTARWSMVKWTDDEGMSIDQKADTAYIECPSCLEHIDNSKKRVMLNRCEWRPHNKLASGKIRSFHFNRIMSPVKKLSDMVSKFLSAVERAKIGDIGELQNFTNSALAEVWREDAGKTISEDMVDQLVDRDMPRGVVPDWALGMVAGVDTQNNGFYYSIHCFGENNRSHLVAESFVTSLEDLEKQVLEMTFGKRRLPVEAVFMDAAGQRTDEVYKFCRKHITKVVPCFGRGNNLLNEYSFSTVDKPARGQVVVGGLMKCMWNTNFIKDQFFARLEIPSGERGCFTMHNSTCREYKKALGSEYKGDRGAYVHKAHIPNHYLDTTALAFLASRYLGIEYRELPKVVEINPEKIYKTKRKESVW